MRRRSNTRFARGVSIAEPDRLSWEAFDALPAPVRAALWEAPVSINPVTVEPLLRNGVRWDG